MTHFAPRLLSAAIALLAGAALSGQAPVRQTIQGEGDHVTAAIALTGGLLMVGGAHKGSRNFIVQLRSDTDELVFNTLGNYQGVRLFPVKPGAHRFQVQSSAAWSLMYEQPDPAKPGYPLPITQAMTGDAPLGPFALQAGLVTATFTHAGSRNFIVELYRANGELVGLLVNKLGAYEGTTAERIPAAGNYWIAVRAYGAWTVKLSQP